MIFKRNEPVRLLTDERNIVVTFRVKEWDQPFPGLIKDLSPSGMRILTFRSFATNQPISVSFSLHEQEFSFSAKIRWREREHGYYLVGLRLETSEYEKAMIMSHLKQMSRNKRYLYN